MIERDVSQVSIKRISVVDQTVEVLREMILSDVLRPGEHLLQDKLASELGISRTPLRQALFKLQEEGLVRLSGTRGVEVTKLDAGEVLELYQVRTALDGLAARLAAQNASPDDVDKLKTILDRTESLLMDPGIHGWVVLNVQFHEAVVQASHNRFLIQLMPYVTNSARMIFRMLMVTPKYFERTYPEHVRVWEAIGAGDPDEAEAAARAHLARAQALIRGSMQSTPYAVQSRQADSNDAPSVSRSPRWPSWAAGKRQKVHNLQPTDFSPIR